jgi:hypothetical protein
MVDEAHRAFHERTVESTGGEPILPAMDSPDRFTLTSLARELHVDRRRLQERAKRLNVLIERRYIQDSNGHRQCTLTTDAAGIEALKRWYSR